jgi:hypothetical protein
VRTVIVAVIPLLAVACTSEPEESVDPREDRGAADESAAGCFETHVVEAIALNEQRKPLYADLTDGDSRRISNGLILFEQAIRLPARLIDDRAARWQEAGLAIGCDEFVPISLTPPFQSQVAPPPVAFERRSGLVLATELKLAFATGGYDKLGDKLEEELAVLAALPGHHCLLRHFLESLLRGANLAPIHAARAAELGLDSPDAISRDLVLLQIAGLPIATKLDADAASIQAKGIPILCQDVPPISPLP